MSSWFEFEPVYIAIDWQEDAAVVRFRQSDLTEDENIEQLGHELFSLVDQLDCRKVVLDLEGVRLVTSSVLGKMITLHRKLHRKEGVLVLCRMRGGVADVMRASRLITYFHTADDLERALALAEGR